MSDVTDPSPVYLHPTAEVEEGAAIGPGTKVWHLVHVRGTGPSDVVLAPVGLTRVAPHGSMVVNSSRGGGAKDTWILGSEGNGDVRSGG